MKRDDVLVLRYKTSVHFHFLSEDTDLFDLATQGVAEDELCNPNHTTLNVLGDSGWNLCTTSFPIRGIRDFERRIQFHEPLNDEELSLVIQWLKTDQCPGWTGVACLIEKNNTYRFFTTWDSSD